MKFHPKRPYKFGSIEAEVKQALVRRKFACAQEIAADIERCPEFVHAALRRLRSSGDIYIADWKRYSKKGPQRMILGIKKDELDIDTLRPKNMISKMMYARQYRLKQKLLKQFPTIGVSNGQTESSNLS